MGSHASLDEKLAPHDFVTDFVWAGRAIFSQPSVLVTSVVLWCLPTVLTRAALMRAHGPFVIVAGFAIALFGFGWYGAERLFFLRQRNGEGVTLSGLIGSVPNFMGRFLRLGTLVGIPAAFLMAFAFLYIGHLPAASRPAATRIGMLIIIVPVDLVLTFVTSALAFTTRSAREALRIGLAMIRQTWPRSGLYVLCPPLALNMLNTIYPNQSPVVSVLTSAVLALIALLAKGATAAFYLRERPVSPDVIASVA